MRRWRKSRTRAAPYDWAHQKLGLPQPAIHVASVEEDRQVYKWDRDFERQFRGRLDAHFQAVQTHAPTPADCAGDRKDPLIRQVSPLLHED